MGSLIDARSLRIFAEGPDTAGLALRFMADDVPDTRLGEIFDGRKSGWTGTYHTYPNMIDFFTPPTLTLMLPTRPVS